MYFPNFFIKFDLSWVLRGKIIYGITDSVLYSNQLKIDNNIINLKKLKSTESKSFLIKCPMKNVL